MYYICTDRTVLIAVEGHLYGNWYRCFYFCEAEGFGEVNYGKEEETD